MNTDMTPVRAHPIPLRHKISPRSTHPVRYAVNGTPFCFERLVREHSTRLLRLARRFVDEDDARDVVQDTFLKAFEALEHFREESCITTWLHRITVNRCLQKLRKASTVREVSIETALPGFSDSGHFATPAGHWPDGALHRLETNKALQACLQQLPVHYRVVVILRDLEGLTGAETAAAAGISVALVKVRLHRARHALRTLLENSLAEHITLDECARHSEL